MKNKQILLALGATFLMACASQEERSTEKVDTNITNYSDTTGIDTNKIDTSNTTEQKSTKDPGL